MSDDIETKLSAARTRLILDKPFLGALVLRLPMHATKPERCKTIGTDVRALYYNPDYISRLSLDQTQYVLAHEALHCVCLISFAASIVLSGVGISLVILPSTCCWSRKDSSHRSACC